GFDANALFGDAIAEMTSAALIEATPSHVRLTRRGQLLSNYVMRAFLDAADQPERPVANESQFVTLNVDAPK
ncbi:MAG: hypothetical protein KDA33_15130, partial [Phycisphaerales bacterium]|nr:hypothetical protein [Phycisphaerales bacterium]